MATFEELMAAAANADRAGDEAAAAKLVSAARSMMNGSALVTEGDIPNDPTLLPQVNRPNYNDAAPPKPDRFGDTIAAATEAPRQALGAYAGGVMGGESPTRNTLPEDMPIGLKSRLGFAGDLAMTGLSALGVGYSAAAGTAGEVLGGSPTNERRLARDLMMMGEVAVPQLAGASSVNRAATRANRAAMNIPEAATDRQRQARAADELGVTPSLGMQGRTGATTAAALEKVPLVGNRIADDAARMVEEVEGVFNRNVAAIGPRTNAASAGSAMQEGLNRFVDRFKERSEVLYGNVAQHIPAETKIQAPETVRLIREALAPFEDNPQIRSQLGLDQWANMASDMEQGLSWQAAMSLRSSLGQSIGKINGPLANMDQGRLKSAYASLTDDLDAAARAAGEDAYRAWSRANDYYRAGSDRITSQLDRTISADSPERALEAFAAMARDQSSTSNATRMRRIKSSLGEEEWSEVAATIVDRMGRATDGAQNAAGEAFSPATFLTNWNRMNDEARRLLMPPAVRNELEKLAEVAEAAKGANAERNFSNTAGAGTGIAAAFAFQSAPVSTSAVVGSLYLGSKSMTNPTFLRAVNRAARGDMRQLRAMANGNGPFADDATTLLTISSADASTTPANTSQAPRISAQR